MRAWHAGDFNKLRLAVNFAGRTTADPGHQWGPRIIPDNQLIYMLAGKSELRLGSSCHELRPGDIGLYGGGTPMVLRSPDGEPFTYYSVHFDWGRESPEPVHPSAGMIYCGESGMAQEPVDLTIDFGRYTRLPIPFKLRTPQLEEPIRQLVDEYEEQQEGYELVLRSRLTVLLAALLRMLTEEQESDTRRKIKPALQLLAQHPDRTWPVAELASACGYQAAYFAELFKAATGTTPKAYMMDQRMRLAKRLLLAGEPIDVIAERLGYSSTHYFHRSFKEETGMTPSEFRMQE
ncbi:AraC-like DNA-binding protein [Paenibacillus phyllosphaerae]|uniref:AraC-like DNA-binding protein n=1 Tax=Paenibacillus phyllosphaerae TaxID=274593 RepID=A0A7W5AZK3_9BACL|nr:AraC family transcriptional regulator [Paenibacillus phyllosphaerae]MBB3111542.1 AraC-like DNA-binding protein [Paenibacillus phyllosphaerae]